MSYQLFNSRFHMTRDIDFHQISLYQYSAARLLKCRVLRIFSDDIHFSQTVGTMVHQGLQAQGAEGDEEDSLASPSSPAWWEDWILYI